MNTTTIDDTHDQLAALESEHARRLDAAFTAWLARGDFAAWWNAVAAANSYLLQEAR